MDKSYIAHIDFSILTDTWDMDFYYTMGKYDIIFNHSEYKKVFCKKEKKTLKKEINYYKLYTNNDIPSLNQIKEILNSFIPSANLPLTMFSAKKLN